MATQSRLNRESLTGLTLIELMVVVAVISALVLIAAPSMVSLMVRNRLATEMNLFIGDLQYSRSEAIKRGASVGLCPSSNKTSCDSTSNWHLGWIVFADTDRSSTFTTGDEIMRTGDAFKAGDVFSADNSLQLILFNRDGIASSIAAVSTITLRDAAGDPSVTRCIELSRVGRHTLEKVGTGSCT